MTHKQLTNNRKLKKYSEKKDFHQIQNLNLNNSLILLRFIYRNLINLLKKLDLFFRHHFFFLIILFVATGLRFYNLNWDNGYNYHPDEKNITKAVSESVELGENTDPNFYAYNGLPIYILEVSAQAVSLYTDNPDWATDWGKLALISRYFSAFYSSSSIIFFYLLALTIFRNRIYSHFVIIPFAFNVGFIQYAHYGVTESFLILMITVISYIVTRSLLNLKYLNSVFDLDLDSFFNSHKKNNYYKKISFDSKNYELILKNFRLTIELLGVLIGFSLAFKSTSILFVVPIIIYGIIHFLAVWNWGNGMKTFSILARYFVILIRFGLISFFVFFAFSPHTFLNYNGVLSSMEYETGVIKGTEIVNYTRQFFGENSFYYFINNSAWHIGPFFVLLGLGGMIIYLVLITNSKTRDIFCNLLIVMAPLFGFAYVYFFYIGDLFTQFARYALLIQPFYILFSFVLLKIIFEFSRNNFFVGVKNYYFSIAQYYLLFILVMINILWAFAFINIYIQTSTKESSSIWVYQYIPSGSYILQEHWDDGIPSRLDSTRDPGRYKITKQELYNIETQDKLDDLSRNLAEADYYVVASRRLSHSLPKNPYMYPVSSTYHEKLLSGEFGYETIAIFEVFPEIFGVKINTHINAEESISVYDHPRVLIMQNKKRLSQEQILKKMLGSYEKESLPTIRDLQNIR